MIALMPGDGVGPEVVREAVRVLDALGLGLEMVEAPVGGAAYRAHGHPLPPETLAVARNADAILFGAVGDFALDTLPRELRPEQAILGLRRELDLFANFRPAIVHPELADASPLKPELIAGLDILIVRELTGDIYFGQPKGIGINAAGLREGHDTMRYDEAQIARVAHVAFQAARKRSGRVASVDKANVLESMQLWRDVVAEVSREYPDVALDHLYVDNAAMQLLKNPKAFDVILTGNMFGDILSDQASMLTGSIGMLPSASLNASGFGLYEPIHGSAPDIAGKDMANPLAAILSAAMMLRFSLDDEASAARIEQALSQVLRDGARTHDIGGTMACAEMGDAVVAAL
ncbi:MAG: 3-isopropylmalate dehydrogenase [Sphingomonadaceae bacterium]|nr:3-isopropylmalate dehydrogenase [Sphingomonadaceae bacterium]